MKWFKRTWLCIIRRPIKSLLLFLVVFVMANLLAGSLSIIQTSSQIKTSLKESIAPEVILTYDSYYIEDHQLFNRKMNFDELNNYMNLVNQMGQDENVIKNEQSYIIENINTYVSSVDLGMDGEEEKLNFKLVSTNVIEPYEFVEGKMKLMSLSNNAFLNEEQLNSDEIYIVVDQQLSAIKDTFSGVVLSTGLNKIGNEVTLTIAQPQYYVDDHLVNSEYKFKAKIVGVLTQSGLYQTPVIYMSNKAMMKLAKEADEYFKSQDLSVRYDVVPSIESTRFSFDSIDNVEAFDQNISDLKEQLKEGVQYDSTSLLYERNIGPVTTLDTIAKVIFIGSLIATITILGLVIVFLIGERKHEMGIYVSLGEKTKHIIQQIVCEVAMVSTLAIFCASLTGLFLGNQLSDYMLEVQRYVQRQQNLGALANVEALYKPIKDGLTMHTRDDVIDNFEVKATSEYFVVIFVVGEVSVMISCIIPMAYLTRLKPKEILL